MTSPLPSSDVSPDQPVFAAQFTGRVRLAQNLMRRCRAGQSLLLHGGPKLGKTSMLRHLEWLIEQERHAFPATPPAFYMDLADERARQHLLQGSDKTRTPILLLDHGDHLLDEHGVSALRDVIQREPCAYAIVWAGASAVLKAPLDQIGPAPLRPVPLAVLFDGEARDLLKQYLTPSELTIALGAGGTHPYVLKVIVHELQAGADDPTRAIQSSAERLVPFFKACREAVRQPSEQTLLRYLVQEAIPVAPQEAADALALTTIKSSADVLCSLGLISRWNLADGARLHASCRLFNEWYLANDQ